MAFRSAGREQGAASASRHSRGADRGSGNLHAMQWRPLVFPSRPGRGNGAVCRHGRHRAGSKWSIGSVVLSLARRIEQVQSRIASAADRAGRSYEDVTLIAVSKTVARDVVDEAYGHGL